MQAVTQIVDTIQKSSHEDLIMWKDVKASAVVFGAGLTAYYLFYLANFSLLLLFLLGSVVVLLVTLVLSFMGTRVVEKKSDEELQDLLAKLVFSVLGVSEGDSMKDVKNSKVVEQIASVLVKLNSVVRWEQRVESFKFLGGAIVAYWVLSCCCITVLVLLGWVLMFTGPVGYMKNKDKIDPILKQVNEQVATHVKKVPKLAELLGYDQKKKQ